MWFNCPLQPLPNGKLSHLAWSCGEETSWIEYSRILWTEKRIRRCKSNRDPAAEFDILKSFLLANTFWHGKWTFSFEPTRHTEIQRIPEIEPTSNEYLNEPLANGFQALGIYSSWTNISVLDLRWSAIASDSFGSRVATARPPSIFRLPSGALHHAPVLRLAGGFPGGDWGSWWVVGSYSLPMTAVLTAAVRYFWPCSAFPPSLSVTHIFWRVF